jgi:hypothetical protein
MGMTMISLISLNAKHMGADYISLLPLKDLDMLKSEIDMIFNDAKEQKEILEEALALRFLKKTNETLMAEGKDSGTIHFEEDSYIITANLPKKVTWNQDKLAAIIPTISPDDRNKYIETTYKIHEQKYLAYGPLSLRMVLDEARELSTGKPKFTLKLT